MAKALSRFDSPTYSGVNCEFAMDSLHNGLAAGLLLRLSSIQLLHRLTPQSAAPQ
jgi:hypothetical protein